MELVGQDMFPAGCQFFLLRQGQIITKQCTQYGKILCLTI